MDVPPIPPEDHAHLVDQAIHPRLRLAALWTSTMLLFAYVDLFAFYRADVRADIEAGTVFVFDIGPEFLLGVTIYVGIASLMVAWSVVGPARAVRVSNLVLAPVYAITIAGGAVGEWSYYVVASAAEVGLLVVVTAIAARWPVR